MLLAECEAVGVDIRTHCEVEAVNTSDQSLSRYQLKGHIQQQAFQFDCDSLVVASGGLSIPTLGGSGIGYDIATQFGLKVTKKQAGLVPFMFSDAIKDLCQRLAGLAIDVDVSCNNTHFRENMLFTHRGISGPAMLQISNYWQPGASLSIHLLPDMNVESWLLDTKQQQPRSLLRSTLSQQLSKGLALELQQLWWPMEADKPLAEFSDRRLQEIAQKLSAWQLKPSATEGYRTAEVTLGGIDTSAIICNSHSYRSRSSGFNIR